MTAVVQAAERSVRPWRAAWRQHGAWVSVVVLLVLLGGAALATTVALIPACASTDWWTVPGAQCDTDAAKTVWALWWTAMQVLPPVAGVLLGAVTFGPDFENRTAVLALTQGVSRLRWWATKVVVTVVPGFVVTLMLGMVALAVVDGAEDTVLWTVTITSPGFDVLGVIPAVRFLLGFAAASLFASRRTLVGTVVGLVTGFVVVQVGSILQPYVVPHQRSLIPIEQWEADTTGWIGTEEVTAYNWSAYADADGREIDGLEEPCPQDSWLRCMQDRGVVFRMETYVLDSTHPQMMLIIGGLDVVVAGAFLGLGARTLSRRDL